MSDRRLPPGQYVPRDRPALHYGPVPRFRPHRWDLRVFGFTESLGEFRWSWPEFDALPRVDTVSDFHCVTRFTLPGVHWGGVSTALLVEQAPPDPSATHVMVWGEYGYSANLGLDDFLRADVVLATHRDGERLTAEHGHPVRLVVPHRYGWKSVKWVRAIEYLAADRRGFWEERGYHNLGDPWSEQRYSYQEEPGQGPPLS
ncbi:molybdopterin-dependent oxidoreductase [Nocardiopsis trehalosi]|uniref:molybdopterin-dependent oxidoreductase n=1 Tax=Nocardiopsis trehalosi TaxID=109329 RepID=UPI0008322EFA|nr:molybdopterin-dependent oxidoreductase [Nocardiopsis trehalosi]